MTCTQIAEGKELQGISSPDQRRVRERWLSYRRSHNDGVQLCPSSELPVKFLRRMWVEQPALGVDDETDYVEEVFDPGDYDDVDDAL